MQHPLFNHPGVSLRNPRLSQWRLPRMAGRVDAMAQPHTGARKPPVLDEHRHLHSYRLICWCVCAAVAMYKYTADVRCKHVWKGGDVCICRVPQGYSVRVGLG